jgi:hypothetical protein
LLYKHILVCVTFSLKHGALAKRFQRFGDAACFAHESCVPMPLRELLLSARRVAVFSSFSNTGGIKPVQAFPRSEKMRSHFFLAFRKE